MARAHARIGVVAAHLADTSDTAREPILGRYRTSAAEKEKLSDIRKWNGCANLVLGCYI